MLDYAANAVEYWPAGSIQQLFSLSCEAQGDDPEVKLAAFLKSSMTSEDFWSRAHENLKSGNIRLVFVADKVTRELQRIVEFLNERMNPTEVLAVELRQFAGEGLTTHIPRVIGQTALAQQTKLASGNGNRTQYERIELTYEQLLDQVENQAGRELRDAVQRIISWASARPELNCVAEQKGQTQFKASLVAPPKTILFSVYTPSHGKNGPNDGRVHHNAFRKLPFQIEEDRHEFFRRIAAIPGLGWTPEEAFKNASIPTSRLISQSAVTHLIETLEWSLGRIQLGGL